MCCRRRGGDNPLTKKQLVMRIIYLILLFVFSVYTLVVSIQIYSNMSDLGEKYKGLLSSWEKDMVTDVRTTMAPSCTHLQNVKEHKDQYWELLFKYDFPGFSNGCDCRGAHSANKYKVEKTLDTGSCSKNETLAGCDSLSTAQSASTIDKFESSRYYCVQRIKDYSFRNKHLVKLNVCNSPSTEKICGKGDTAFCIPKQISKCPITSLDLISLSSGSSIGDATRMNNTIGKTAMNLFLVRQGSKVCRVNYNRLTRADEYKLMRGKYYNCDSYADNRFVKLSTSNRITEKQVFVSNFNRASIFPTQDRYKYIYSTYSKYDFNFFGRNSVLWKVKKECTELIRPLFLIKESFESVVSIQLTLLIVNILTLIILGIVFNILAIFNTLNFDITCVKGEGVEEYKRLNLIRKICSYSTKMLQAPFMIVAVVVSSGFKHYFEISKQSQCSDPDENNFFAEIADIVSDKIYAGNISQLSFLCFMIVLDIIVHFVTKKQIEMKEKAEREEKERLQRNKDNYQRVELEKQELLQNQGNIQHMVQQHQQMGGGGLIIDQNDHNQQYLNQVNIQNQAVPQHLGGQGGPHNLTPQMYQQQMMQQQMQPNNPQAYLQSVQMQQGSVPQKM